VVDATFEDGAHQIIGLVVAFLVVTRVSTAYSRYWEARTALSRMLHQARQLASHASNYSRFDTSARGDQWRNLLRKRLVRVVEAAIEVTESPEKAVKLVTNTIPQDEKARAKDPMQLITYVHAAISMQKEFLKKPFIIHKEVRLHQFALDFTDAYDDLTMCSSTPYPFPTAQMTRAFLFVWLFTLPLSMVHETDDILSRSFITFFVTYGFFGLEFVSIELDDPFGDDANDIETAELSKITIAAIESILDFPFVLQTGKRLVEFFDHDDRSISASETTSEFPLKKTLELEKRNQSFN